MELRDALESSRLVTLFGPSGVGKSRLAAEALRDGADHCSIETAPGADEVRRAVARTLGTSASASVPLEVVIARARARRPERPLVLDGADRALPALRTLLAEWVDAEGGPIVVTACRALGLPGERTIEVAPLDLTDAIELFLEAARSHGHTGDRSAAAAIVDALDRLPLAIEWFAARAATLGDEAALDELSRHRAAAPLTAALDATLASLRPDEHEALSLLAMFEDGATIGLLEEALGGDFAPVDALLSSSLARAVRRPGRPTRIAPYRTVTARVRERERREGRIGPAISRHAELVLGLFALPPTSLTSAPRAELADERAELEAIRQRLGRVDPVRALRARLLLVPLHVRDGTAKAAAVDVRELLAALPSGSELTDDARVALGMLARRCGDVEDARAQLSEALKSEGAHRFDARIELAALDRLQSRLDEALAGYQQALEDARAEHDPAREAIALGEIGRILQSLGRTREAQAHHVEAIALSRSIGLRDREALERSLHARATHRAGEVHEAIPLHEAALALHRELGDHRLAAAERGHLGFCLHEVGELDRAAVELRASIEGLADAGDVALEAIERALLARLLTDLGRLSEARLELGIAARLTRGLAMPRLSLTHDLVAGLAALREGRLPEAREVLRRALDAGVLFEVGFEALLPAYLALVESALGVGDPAALIAESEAAIERIDDDGPRAALGVLRAAVENTPMPELPSAVLARSSDARRSLALAGALGRRPLALAVARDGRGAVLPDGSRVELSRRKAPRLLLLALARSRLDSPGRASSRDELVEAGWPGERMSDYAADKRLRTTIWTLRRLGFERLLLTRDEGYLLDPFVPLVWTE